MGEQLQSVCVFYYGDIVKLFTIVTFLYDDEPFPRQFPQNQRKTKEKQKTIKVFSITHIFMNTHVFLFSNELYFQLIFSTVL